MFVNARRHESITVWSSDSRHGWGINGATAPGGAVERNWANVGWTNLAPTSMGLPDVAGEVLTPATTTPIMEVVVLESSRFQGESTMKPSKHLDQLIQFAYVQLQRERGASADSILANPDFRRRLLDLMDHHTGGAMEEIIFLRLLALRKKKGGLPPR